MNKKTFCILEQSGDKNNPITKHKKDLFTTDFSDFYRLNWKLDDDPLADFVEKGVLWSEGRSLLWEKVPKDYDYYIFTDDDIVFSNNVGQEDQIPYLIKDLLEEYKPISATFYDPGQWAFNKRFSVLDDVLKKNVFPIAGFDLQVHIFSKEFAELMFPVIYHGAAKCMWYSQWIATYLYPDKQICFNDIQVSNTKNDNHHNNATPLEADVMVWKFFKSTKFNKTIRSHKYFLNRTKEIYSEEINKNKINFSVMDLHKVLKKNSILASKNRSPKLDQNNRINKSDIIRYFLNLNNLGYFLYVKIKSMLRKLVIN